jgi:hypothetical protein
MKDFKKVVSILILEPIFFGVLGFAGFYSVLYILKGFNYITGKRPGIHFTNEDYLLTMVGLSFAFLMKFIGNMKEVKIKH